MDIVPFCHGGWRGVGEGHGGRRGDRRGDWPGGGTDAGAGAAGVHRQARGGGAGAGEVLAQDVLAKVLGAREVQLALDVLRGGVHADHRLVDLCEVLLERWREASGWREG